MTMDGRSWARHQRGRIAAWVLIVVGVLVLVLGWVGVARSSYPAQQLPYLISGGLGGLALIGLGALLWLSSDLEDEWTKLDLIEDALRELAGSSKGLVTFAEPDEVEATDQGTVAKSPRRSRRLQAEATSSA